MNLTEEKSRSARYSEPKQVKVPPHSNEAEQSVLGGVMLDGLAWDKISGRISVEDFYYRAHQVIFEAMETLFARHRPVDVLTLSEVLKDKGQIEEIGGEIYLFELAKNTPSVANLSAYADIVRERSVLRQLISVANDIADSAFHSKERDPSALLDEAERKVFAIAQQGSNSSGPQKIAHVLSKAVDRIDFLFHSDSPITGVSTGYHDLDEMTAGLQPSDLIIVAGRPSMGKTAFSLNMAEHAAIKEKKPVLVFSMEMPAEQLAMRLISSLGRIDQHKLRTGKLSNDDWPRVTSAVSILSEASLFIDDTPALNPSELRSRARRVAREHGNLGMIVIDYLQLMQVSGGSENRATEISEISRSLKALAKELHVPVIALSQLNRGLEQRADKRPIMSDLRECVTGDTLVNLADGRRVPIAELVDQEVDVIAVNAQKKLVAAKCEKIWKVGKKPVYKINLASGRMIRATDKHRIMRFGGWAQVLEMEVGDKIATVNSTFISESNLQEHANSDLFWDRIVAIEADGEEDVYDLTVPVHESWLADGIVSHNSGAIEQDADVIMFIYRDEVYHENSPDKGVAEIIIGKQRNGPIGRVRLTFLGKYTRFENFASEGGGYQPMDE
jgi:replicative DNA helicase